MNPGNILLYSSLILALGALLSLKVRRGYTKHLIRGFTALIALDFLLLVYYFVTGDFTYHYVWSYSSQTLPLAYKLSGVLGGQQGTLLFWALIIAASALWLSELKPLDSFYTRATAAVLAIFLYFSALTAMDSPFKTIYEVYEDLNPGFVPPDGNGLNPLLIDPWMAVHPPTVFLGYATLTVPFALALSYLFSRIRGEELKDWAKDALLWSRVSWLFLTMGIAFGGFWSYKVLGWGGFWAWDPVETASLIPWLLLTGTMHALLTHSRNPRKFEVLAPLLVGLSFVLMVYSTLVTRSGFFESVHAFGSGEVGRYLLLFIGLCLLATLGLGVAAYNRLGRKGEETKFLTYTTLLYATVLCFAFLTFISFWGISYPAVLKLSTGVKVGVVESFYNIWSYPLVVILLLLMGLCFGLRRGNREKRLREFALFSIATLLLTLVTPTQQWNIVDYSAVINPDQPLLYSIIGGASVLSILPPLFYVLYSTTSSLSSKRKLKSTSLAMVHIGVALIVVGSAFSTLFDSEVEANLPLGGQLVKLEGTDYSLQARDFREGKEYTSIELGEGMTVSQFMAEIPEMSSQERVKVRGEIAEVLHDPSLNLAFYSITDGQSSVWVASESKELERGEELVVTGSIFKSVEVGGRTLSTVLLGERVERSRKMVKSFTEVDIAIMNSAEVVARGTARVEDYPNGNVRKVMIERRPLADIYVIFTGARGDWVPVTVKLIPMINLVWVGTGLLLGGMLLSLARGRISGRFSSWR